MRIAFLFNYPLVDNTPWKQRVIAALNGHHELLVVFGKTRPQDYVRTYLRKRQEETIRAPGGGGATRSQEKLERTTRFLARLKIPVRHVGNVNDARAIGILRDFKPDYVVTALDQLASKALIAEAGILLNVHYGLLPEVKGWNATEWSLLEHGRLSVSLHRVAWPVDTGPIYLTRDIPVERSDDLGTLRAKCQDAAVELYTDFFRDPARHVAAARDNSSGRTYYVMNRRLKSEVLSRIRAGRLAPALAA